ncbi:MAG: hypothetical protein ORN28_02025, partial [Rhodoferax sp.]|nr:hypothetical protein [Rhodoferax sp.]
IDLKPTTVTAGSYTSANITVDSKGRVTAASNGSSTIGPNWTALFDSGGAAVGFSDTAARTTTATITINNNTVNGGQLTFAAAVPGLVDGDVFIVFFNAGANSAVGIYSGSTLTVAGIRYNVSGITAQQYTNASVWRGVVRRDAAVLSGTTAPTDATGNDGQSYQLLDALGNVIADYSRAAPSPATGKWKQEPNVRITPNSLITAALYNMTLTVANPTVGGTVNFQRYTPACVVTYAGGKKAPIPPFVVSVTATDTLDTIAAKIVAALSTVSGVTFSKIGVATTSGAVFNITADASVNSVEWGGVTAQQVGDAAGNPVPRWQNIAYQAGAFVIDANNAGIYRCIQNAPNTIG